MQAPIPSVIFLNTISNAVASATNSDESTPSSLRASLGSLLASRWLERDTYWALLEHFITTALYLAIALLVWAALSGVIRRVCALARVRHPAQSNRSKKIDTAESIALSVARYSIACVALFKTLLLWGVSAQSLTVGSAIIAGAIGFGSQGLVQDMITGFTLLFEDQLRVGDYVQIGDKTGYVREVGLRVVKLESIDGSEHILFNRQITGVSNLKSPPPQA